MAKRTNVTSSNKNDIPLMVAEHGVVGLGVVDGGGVDGAIALAQGTQ